jgi:hypothetical protein
MIEKIILDYLNDVLDYPCYMEKPENAPDDFILIERTSGSSENYIQSATFAVQSYSTSLYGAAALNEKAVEAMEGLIELNSISKSKKETDYNFTDTSKKGYRYQAVFDITYFKGE